MTVRCGSMPTAACVSAAVASQSSSSLGRHGGEKKEKEEGETDEAEFMFHSLIFFLVFLFAFIPFVQEPVVWQRQGSMFFVLKTVEVPQWSFQSWKCSGAIISSMCARLCLTFILVCSRSRRCCARRERGNPGCSVCAHLRVMSSVVGFWRRCTVHKPHRHRSRTVFGKWCLGTGVPTHRGAVRGRPPCLGLLWKFCSGQLVPLARI